MSVVPRLEWPSGFTVEDILAGAGRVERQLNANGDPVYVGYAPKPDSRTDAPGWLVEYYLYDGSNKLLTVHRKAGIAWNQRTQILAFVHLKDIPPATASISIIEGTILPVQHRRGSVVGAVALNQVGSAVAWNQTEAKMVVAPLALACPKSIVNTLVRGIGEVAQIVVSALEVADVEIVKTARAVGTVSCAALALGYDQSDSARVVGTISIAALEFTPDVV